MAGSDKWILRHGCHRGTITSRDTAQPEESDSEAEAREKLRKHKEFYRSIGYVIWFAELESPTGQKTTLESNSNYR